MNKFVVMTRHGATETLHYTSENPKWILAGKNGMKLIESKGKSKKDLVLINSSNHFGVKCVAMKNVDHKELLQLLGYLPEGYSGTQIDLKTTTNFAKIYHDDLFVLITKLRQILISVDGVHFKICGPFRTSKRGHVTSVTYYSNIFVLGFACGTLNIYFTKDPIDLLSVDFDKPGVTLKADIWPLISIDVKMGIQNQTVILAVCSESDIQKFTIKKGCEIE